MNIRCIIVDDELLALDVLEGYISNVDSLELVARCNNAVEAYNILQKTNIDLAFLDIEMPKLSGIELLKNISHPPKVIFTTAYRNYAIEGFELEAIDYLLKPISFERFLKAVNKVLRIGLQENIPEINFTGVNESAYSKAFVYVKVEKSMVKVLLKDILYIESLKNYVRIKTTKKEFITYKSISSLEEKLPAAKFLRVHRSFIIAIDKIEILSANSILIHENEIPIGRSYKAMVDKKINLNML